MAKNKYKIKYSGYQKNAIVLISVLSVIIATVIYLDLQMVKKDAANKAKIELTQLKKSSKVNEVTDINAELDKVLSKDQDKTYKDLKYSRYNSYLQEQKRQKVEDALARQRFNQDKVQREALKEQQKKVFEYKEELRLQEEMLQRQKLEQEQKRAQAEAIQKQKEAQELQRQAMQQAELQRAEAERQKALEEENERQKYLEKQRKQQEREARLQAIRNSQFDYLTDEQRKDIEECKRRAERREQHNSRLRNPNVKSTHKNLNQINVQNRPTDKCEHCSN